MLQSTLKENAIIKDDDCFVNLSATNTGIAAFNSFTVKEDCPLCPLYLRKSNAERDLISIQPMSLEDLEQIKDNLQTDFDKFWNYNVFKKELENPNSEYFVAVQDDKIIGFAGIWTSVDDIHITNIVTKKDKRNHGIGNKLLEHLITVSQSKNLSSLTLEVNEKNITAINLYEKHHFKKVGLRKNYYGQNENAIIMTYYF